jgi:hypothetical protein
MLTGPPPKSHGTRDILPRGPKANCVTGLPDAGYINPRQSFSRDESGRLRAAIRTAVTQCDIVLRSPRLRHLQD